jgi:hypothetical protein
MAALALLAASARLARAQVTPAPGYAVQAIPTPAVVQGGVVRRGNTVLVGQGAFGPGLASIVRLEAGRATTIATGFGGLGGFDLAGDGTLYVVDNCYTTDFMCDTSTTGDTVYAIPDALTRTTPIAAGDAELLPAGAIPFPYDVAVTPLGLLVSDAAGPGAGRVVRVEAAGTTDVATGLGYAAGIAYDAPSLFVADVGSDFTGRVEEFVDGSPLGALVDALAGASGLALDGEGDLVLGAGAELLGIDAAGDTTVRASGFGFAGDVAWDGEREAALVLDFGASAVTVVCPDEDGDQVCDGDCSDGASLDGAVLQVKGGREAGRGSLRLKARLRVEGGLSAEPAADGLRVQVRDAAGAVVLDVALPGGAAWRTKKNERGWIYRDPAGALAVTTARVTLDRRDDELVTLVVQSKKQLAVDPGTLSLPLRATLVLDPFGECGSRAFAACTTRGARALKCT